jgi:hypothetical protein
MSPRPPARRRISLGVAVLVLASALAVALGGTTSARAGGVSVRPVCAAVPAGFARCFSFVKGNGTPLDVTAPAGYGPADLQSAYALPSASGGSGQTVAIVDAFDDPTAESDLGSYRSYYGLPPCTTANGCFRKVNETGGTLPPPPPNPDWGLEISLDLDMVSAVCPNCHILLVEANTNLDSDLYTAEDTAAALGANAISNSWGGSEYKGRDRGRRPLQPPRPRHHGQLGRQRLRRRIPGRLALRDRGRRHLAQPRRRKPRLERDRLERRGQRL